MTSVKITLQHFILVFTEVFCITSCVENYTQAAYGACSFTFYFPFHVQDSNNVYEWISTVALFLRACTRCGLRTCLSKCMVVEEQSRQSLEQMPFSQAFLSISLTVLITWQIWRKQNLRFAVTLTEVVLLRGLHEWIKLYSMHDLSGQTAVAVFVAFFSRFKIFASLDY